jgi:hypothetical protein
MGNQPSAPQPTPSAPQNTPPPLPPVCDAACQRQKTLDGLKAALDAKSATRDQDPEGYEQARINYYTALKGQGWLAEEKNKIAKRDIEPTVSAYTTEFKNLSDQKKNQGVFVNLMATLKADEENDVENLKHIRHQAGEESDKARVLNRLNELSSSESTTDLPMLIDIILAVLGLYILYKIYTKYVSGPSTPIGGKRLPIHLTR